MVLIQELRRVRAGVPFGGMGLSLIGPTLLELGTEDQKQRHIPPIVRGEEPASSSTTSTTGRPGAVPDLVALASGRPGRG